MKKNTKKFIVESILASSILITGSFANERAESEKNEASTVDKYIYGQLYVDVQNGNRLVGFDEEGNFISKPYTEIKYIPEDGYKVDYTNKVAYRTIKVLEQNDTANKIYKYTIIRNDLLSLASLIFTSTCVCGYETIIEECKKLIKK